MRKNKINIIITIMNTLIYRPFALLSLLALVVVAPLGASATSFIYAEPITINNPMPAAGDFFGYSVSMSGDKVLIGAHNDSTGANTAGSAYLYDNTTGALLQTFNNPVPAQNDYFGRSVSVSGERVLIGTPGDDTGALEAGSAYLFDSTNGVLLHTFSNPTPAEDESFGSSVFLSEDKVFIGAYNDHIGAGPAVGSVYLYDATTGALLHTFNNPTPAAYDNFGYSVSVSGDKVLIGASQEATNFGLAYLFDATTGVLLQTFNNPTPAVNDQFGYSVSISGDNVLIGARYDDSGAYNTGSAYLFNATTGALLQTFNNPTPAARDNFGSSVSISGDKVLIGEPWDNTVAYYAGSAYLYDATTGDLLQTFNNPAPADYDIFGISVSISGDTVLIGALGYGPGAGSVGGSAYLYLLQPDTDDDGIEDSADNCPANANPDQTDTDGDGQGDVCDFTPNGDTDGDGIDNLADNCPADLNVDQADTDSDGQGNLCDFTPNGDTDGDGVDELADNCPGMTNLGQEDNDSDGLGNVCDPTPDGDPDPNPTSIDQCRQLGWMGFSFRNQGQCVALVNTGHDSR